MSISRQMRRRLASQKGMTPIGRPDQMKFDPDRMMLGIRYDEATLNWQASLREIQQAYKLLANTPAEREFGEQEYKKEMRNVIIFGIQKNDHLKLREGNLMATIAMWYMWLKRDTIVNPTSTSWDRIGRLTMVIEPGENNWFQFKWEIKLKDDLKLPDLERINVWTPFRTNPGRA